MLVPTVVAVAPSVVFVTSVFVARMMIVPAAEVSMSRSVVAAARVAAACVAVARVAAARVAAARVAAARVAAARVASARVAAARVGMVHLSCFDVVGREVTICGAHVDVDLFAHSCICVEFELAQKAGTSGVAVNRCGCLHRSLRRTGCVGHAGW